MIKSAIQRVLTRFPRVNALQRVIRHLHDKNYCYAVLEADHHHAAPFLHWIDPRCLYFEHLGKMHPKEFLYVYKEHEAIGGFFAQHRRLLLGLAFADHYGLKPIVYFGEDYRYHEEQPIDGTINGFEYYFEQPSGIKYEEALVSQNVVFFTPIHLTMLSKGNFSYYTLLNEELEYLSRIQKKYIRIKKKIQDDIFQQINHLLQRKKTLAVHIRGTDFRLGLVGHPKPIEVKAQIKRVIEIMKQKQFDQVFLATDEVNTISEFEQALGDKVKFYDDVFRSENETAAQYSFSDRELHQYKLGLEVLRDMLTLASCDGLIAGLSQVSFCARITKRSWDQEYEFLEISDNGRFKENTYAALETIKKYMEDGRIPTSFK